MMVLTKYNPTKQKKEQTQDMLSLKIWRAYMTEETTLSSAPNLIQNERHVEMRDVVVLGKAQMFFLRAAYH